MRADGACAAPCGCKDTTRIVVKFGENAGNGLKCVFFDVRVLSLHREGVRYETNLLRHGTTAQKKARLEGRAIGWIVFRDYSALPALPRTASILCL